MKRTSQRLVAVLLLILTPLAFGDNFLPERPYYSQMFFQEIRKPGQSDQILKNILFSVLSKQHVPNPNNGFDDLFDTCPSTGCYGQRQMDYRQARIHLFGQLHLGQDEEGYAIKDVYCLRTFGKKDFKPGRPTPAPDKIPDPLVINAEHTWPQSKFSTAFPKDLQRGDLHILYPAFAKANTSRGNRPFNFVNTQTASPCKESKLGYSSRSSGGNGRVLSFEPPDEHKGNVARAIFYFSVRYKMKIDENQEEALKEWMHIDPPDDAEKARNEAIFKIQGNRNPFIDYPAIADLIKDF